MTKTHSWVLPTALISPCGCCMSSLFNLFSDINSPGDRQSVGLRKGPKKCWELTLGLLLAVTLHHGLHEKNMLHLFCLY